MKQKLTSVVFLILLSLMMTACVGPPKDDKCIPSDGSTTTNTGGNSAQTNSPGAGGSFAQQVDDAVKNGAIITTIITDIKTQLVGTDGSFTASQGIFEGFVTSPEYQTALTAAFSLFIIFYGMSVAVGMVQVSLGDAAIRVAKIGFIAAVALNWETFYGLIGHFFIAGTDEMILYFMGNFSALYSVAGQAQAATGIDLSATIFLGYDALIAKIFSFQTFAFISALLHAGVYAPIYAMFLVMALYWLLQSILKVVQVYIFSLFAKALLFAIAPIFLTFLLFEKTKLMFDAWLSQLISFSMQPILITAYIGLFSNLLMPFFEQFTQYKMCWNRLDNTSDEHGWRFVQAGSNSNEPIDFGSNSAPPIGLQTVLLFMFFAWLFKTALNMTDAIVVSIVQSAAGNLGEIEGLRGLARGGIGGAGNSPLMDRLTRSGQQTINRF